MADIDKIISTEQLDDDKKELADLIELEAYKKLVVHYGGRYIYVPKSDTIIRKERDAEICCRFNGSNYSQLAQKYNLTEKRIRSILRRKY